jgi:hypothetical protein
MLSQKEPTVVKLQMRLQTWVPASAGTTINTCG